MRPIARRRWPLMRLALRLLPALLLVSASAPAHHPVGIPRYREVGGEMVVIYNVLTEDYVVRLQARPGRPVAPPPVDIDVSVDIRPRDPAVLFEGGTWLSVAEDLGNEGEREARAPERKSEEPGARQMRMTHRFDRPGAYLIKVEFTESPGREVLSFPLAVERSGTPAGELFLKVGLPVVLVLAALVLARLAANRRRRGDRG